MIHQQFFLLFGGNLHMTVKT